MALQDETDAAAEPEREAGNPPSSEAFATVADAFAEALAPTAAGSSRPGTLVAKRPPGRLGVAARQVRGREARTETPRGRLAVWEPGPDRSDPIELLRGQDASRVQALIPVRHARMAASAFTFYRGSALVMASDLAGQPRTSLTVQLCGDAHLSNFGLFGAPDRSVVFDLNDFDETHPGPFEWDVKRLATSFVLAARDNGLADEDGLAAATTAAASYRRSIASFARKTELDIWYERVDQRRLESAVQEIGDRKRREHATALLARSRRAVEKARARDAWSVIENHRGGRLQTQVPPPTAAAGADRRRRCPRRSGPRPL